MTTNHATERARKALYYKIIRKRRQKRVAFNLFRLGLFLSLIIFISTSLISYGAAMETTMKLHRLHDVTHSLIMDNVDEKLNVEAASSLYRINNNQKRLTKLHKPDKIIEVHLNNKNLNVKLEKYKPLINKRVVVGY